MPSSASPVVPSTQRVVAPWMVALAGVALGGAVFAAYAGTFSSPFVLDDTGTIADNPTLRGLWSSLFPPNNGIPVTGRPVANLSFALNYAVSGTQVWSYHAANLLIHLGAALALFGILRRTLGWMAPDAAAGLSGFEPRGIAKPADTRMSFTIDSWTALWLAWIIASLWAVHPLQTEAVTYLSQRVESLMGLFYLLTLYGFIRGVAPLTEVDAAGLRREMSSPRTAFQGSSRFWFGFSIVACLLGMATKEVMVTVPVLVLLYDRTFLAGTFRRALGLRWRYYAAAAGTWCLLGFLVWRTGTRGGTAGFGTGVPWWAYALTQIRAVAHYLRLAIWPHPLIADYGRILGGPTGEIIVGLVVLAVLAGLTVWALGRHSRWGFLGAWFFVVLLPSSSVVPVSTEIIAERRMYLPLAAVVAAIVLGVHFATQALARSRGWIFRPLAVGAGIFWLLTASALAAATVARNRVYQGVETLWADVVEKAPENAGAWNNLGNALAEKQDLAGAEPRYREALRLVPAYADAHTNLGNLLLRTGRPDEAVEHYQQALLFRPEDASLRRALGVAAYRSGNARAEAGHPSESVGYYQLAITMTPDSVDAHVNFGSVLAELGRNPEAMREFQAALQLQPGSADIHNNLGGLLAQDGRWAEAEAQFEAALRLQPDFPAARNNLEQLRQMMKRRGGR